MLEQGGELAPPVKNQVPMKTRAIVTSIPVSILAASLAITAAAQDKLETSPIVSSPNLVVPAAGSTYISGWLADMVKLARSGIQESVLLPFVDSAGTFNLDADNIIYLRDLGVSSEVIAAMMRHDQEIAAGIRQPHPFIEPTTRPEIATLLNFFEKSKTSEAAAPPGGQASVQPVVSLFSTTSSSALAVAEPSTSVSIVVESRTQDAFSDLVPIEPAGEGAVPAALATTRLPAGWTTSTLDSGRYPVREPYPVRLTNTVVMIRGAGRQPNLMIIDVSR